MHTATLTAHPTRTPAVMQRMRQLAPGLALTGVLAFASIQLGKIGWLQSNGISALTLAIVLGMVVGNTVYPRLGAMAGAGVTFSKANLLRLGIILYGLRLTFQDIGHNYFIGAGDQANAEVAAFIDEIEAQRSGA